MVDIWTIRQFYNMYFFVTISLTLLYPIFKRKIQSEDNHWNMRNTYKTY